MLNVIDPRKERCSVIFDKVNQTSQIVNTDFLLISCEKYKIHAIYTNQLLSTRLGYIQDSPQGLKTAKQ